MAWIKSDNLSGQQITWDNGKIAYGSKMLWSGGMLWSGKMLWSGGMLWSGSVGQASSASQSGNASISALPPIQTSVANTAATRWVDTP
jgi:hypothetical protein